MNNIFKKAFEKIVKVGVFIFLVIFGELGLRLFGYRTRYFVEKIPKKNGYNKKSI